eukprot:gene22722-21114_t
MNLQLSCGLAMLLGMAPIAHSLPPQNVLFIVIDDLRAELPMYGAAHVHTANLQSLADDSLIFDRAYCNQPVCSPSRNSFMSGRRPSTTKIWNFISSFRQQGPNWVTLPSHFKDQGGYLTLGTGKLFHPGHPVNGDGNKSWSNLQVQFSCNHSEAGGAATYCLPGAAACEVPGTQGAPNPRWCGLDAPLNGSIVGTNITSPFADIVTLEDALIKLDYATQNRRDTGQPWFLGVGFQKPHLDWRIPKGWLDLYPKAAEIKVAKHPTAQPL